MSEAMVPHSVMVSQIAAAVAFERESCAIIAETAYEDVILPREKTAYANGFRSACLAIAGIIRSPAGANS